MLVILHSKVGYVQEKIKYKLLEKILDAVPFDGWSEAALANGATKAGHHPGYALLIFPGGAMEALDYYLEILDEHMLTPELKETKTTARIREALERRFDLLAKHKLVAARTVAFLALPWNLPAAIRFVWRTVDTIWHEAGNDRSTDFNYYSKRSLLAAVYSSTLLHFLQDDSQGHKDTLAFLDRRLEEVLKAGKMIHEYTSKVGL